MRNSLSHKQWFAIFLALGLGSVCPAGAQTTTASSYVSAQPQADRTVPFRLSDAGIKHESVQWGGDLAWFSEENLRRCVAFMGKDVVDVVRVSFQPTHALENGQLHQNQIDTLLQRVQFLNNCVRRDVELTLNCDHPHVDEWYLGKDKFMGLVWDPCDDQRWVDLIYASKAYYEEAGYKVVSIAPYNEPDNIDKTINMGTPHEATRKTEFRNIVANMKGDARFDGYRLCGGNTLNCDYAMAWYDNMDEYLDEGNTHQLAGSFDNYAAFHQRVRSDGKHATNDEMHNIMEGMVGLEYGLQTGIWWGAAEYVRGEFCKATHGERLAYAEHRSNWTAASVYRAPDGKVQAFGGTSERQANPTTYRFVSEERDVFFDGQGPQREYVMSLPGGAPGSYQDGQTNAEGVVNITYGEDIQPYVNGLYVIYNKGNNKVMEIENGSSENVANIQTGSYSSTKNYQQWNVTPVPTTIGGGFSYYGISSVANGKSPDVLNFSLDEGANIISYDKALGENQQWYLEYAGDGWFYIRSRFSSLCLEAVGTNVQQEAKDGADAQLWRFLPVIASHSIKSVSAPTDVAAQAQSASVRISWTNPGNDYTQSILRAEAAGGPYELIARGVQGGEFVDNKVRAGKTYYYTVKSTDQSLNTSPRSEEVSASPTGVRAQVAFYGFEYTLADASENVNTPAVYGTAVYNVGRGETKAVTLDGSSFLQLSTGVASHDAMTVAAWINWNGNDGSGERLFEFAAGEDRYFYCSPSASGNTVCAGIKNGTQEVKAEAAYSLKGQWTHIAVTIGDGKLRLYVNGAEKASADCTLKPSDFMPFMNYIGRGQAAGAANFIGYVDNFHIYNYAMTAAEVGEVMAYSEEGSNEPGVDNPIQTDYVVNPTFEENNTNGWTWVGDAANFSTHSGNQSNDVTNIFCEAWAQNSYVGKIQQTINNLPDGVYELKAAVFRGNLVNVSTGDRDVVYLFANDDETLVTTSVGTYHTVLTTVTGGTLTIGLESKEAIYQWMGIDNVSLTYYGDVAIEDVRLKTIRDRYAALQAEAGFLLRNTAYVQVTGAERSGLETLRTFEPEATEAAYEAAIADLNAGMAALKAALPYYQFFGQELENARTVGLEVSEAEALFADADVDAAALKDAFGDLYTRVNRAIDAAYTVDITDRVGAISTWTGEMVSNKGQHWDGTATSTYMEQTGEQWGLPAWTTYMEKTVALPAGKYALRAAGRTCSDNVELCMSVDGRSVRFPVNGDTGYGIATNGELTFETGKTYANGGAGRGWEARTCLFELAQPGEVTFRVDCEAVALHEWMSITSVELLAAETEVELTVTEAGWATLMLPFEAEVPEGLTVYSCESLKSEELLALTEVTSIEANKPYIVAGEGTYSFSGMNTADASAYTSGYLTGVYAATPAPVGSYVLQNHDGVVAFYKVVDGMQPTVGANRAYVTLPPAQANVLRLIFGDDATAIDDAVTDVKPVDVYTIDGVLVCKGVTFGEALRMLKKGEVYIIGGRKVVVR